MTRAVRAEQQPGPLSVTIKSLQRNVITPPRRWPGLALGELWRLRSIAFVLARRSLMVRYRQTVIGAAWVLAQPLTMMLVFTVFFGILTNVNTQGVPYPVFVYIGLMIWMIVSRVLSEGTTSIVANASLLSKIYFPRAYFPIGVALGSLVDFLFGIAVLILLLLYFHVSITIGIVAVPFLTAVALAAVLGVGFWLSALNTEYRDVAQLLPFLTQLWFFITPIIYSSAVVPEPWRSFYWLNPMAVVVEGFRWAFSGSEVPSPEAWITGTVVSVVLLVTGYVFFRSREPSFPDVV